MSQQLIQRADDARVNLYRMRLQIKDVAAELGVTREHLSRVLNGHIISRSLVEELEEWINKTEGSLAS